MEITLEKIELVRDKTGLSYKGAKEALEAKNGSVIDAIIAVESGWMPEAEKEYGANAVISDYASQIVNKVRELVQKGNIIKIIILKDEDVVLNIPLNIGILGAVFAPWVSLGAAIIAVGARCNIHLVMDDGGIVDLSGKINETLDEALARGSVLKDDVIVKGGAAFAVAKDKANDVFERASEVKEKAVEKAEDVKVRFKNIKGEEVPEDYFYFVENDGNVHPFDGTDQAEADAEEDIYRFMPEENFMYNREPAEDIEGIKQDVDLNPEFVIPEVFFTEGTAENPGNQPESEPASDAEQEQPEIQEVQEVQEDQNLQAPEETGLNQDIQEAPEAETAELKADTEAKDFFELDWVKKISGNFEKTSVPAQSERENVSADNNTPQEADEYENELEAFLSDNDTNAGKIQLNFTEPTDELDFDAFFEPAEKPVETTVNNSKEDLFTDNVYPEAESVVTDEAVTDEAGTDEAKSSEAGESDKTKSKSDIFKLFKF